MGNFFGWLGAFKDEASIAMREPDPAEKARQDASILAKKQKHQNLISIAKRNEQESNAREEREEIERQAAQKLQEEQAEKNAKFVKNAPQRKAEHNAYMAAAQEKIAKLKAARAEREEAGQRAQQEGQQGGKRRSTRRSKKRRSMRRSKKRRGTKRQVR
jgi:hypothetical protein